MLPMLELIKKAAKKIKGVVEKTPLTYSSSFSSRFGFKTYLKLENLQKTGSFKARGAYNKLSSLKASEKNTGVITASSGNHAQGVSWAATLLGMPSTIVMPVNTPIIKYTATRSYGGDVVFYGNSFDEAYRYGLTLAEERGLTFIPPFDDTLVIAGQGTIGLEIIKELPDVDTVVVPIGGGGLISGIAAALKETDKRIRVIGVEAKASASCIASLKKGRPVDVEKRPTIADGIAIKKIGEVTFPIIERYVDDVVAVKEETIAEAILKLLERKKLVVEGAGAAALAAAMEGRLPRSTKKAVFVVSGGNIDVTTLDRVIRLGLIREGRVVRISTVISDTPGALAELTKEIASLKANILHIVHERDAATVSVGETKVDVIIEVEGKRRGRTVIEGLRKKGFKIG